MRLGTARVAARVAAAVSAVSALLSTGAAGAADMPSYYAPPGGYAPADPPLEFGTGWYLRGDASFGPEDKPKLLLRDDVPTFDSKASALGYGFGGGAGYKFTEHFRADITADYLDPFHYDAVIPCGATCSIDRQTNLWRWDGLVNGYLDLGDWFGVTPYVGAGAGVSGTHQDGSIAVDGAPLAAGVIDPRTGTLVTSTVPSRTDYRFAWAAMAGFSYAFAPHMLADVGYRYLDLGRTAIPLFPAAGVTRDLSSQQVRVGVRYMID